MHIFQISSEVLGFATNLFLLKFYHFMHHVV
jgi:hypothetical protein